MAVPEEGEADVFAGDGGTDACGLAADPPQLLAAAVTAMITPARIDSRIRVMAAPNSRVPGISRYVCAFQDSLNHVFCVLVRGLSLEMPIPCEWALGQGRRSRPHVRRPGRAALEEVAANWTIGSENG